MRLPLAKGAACGRRGRGEVVCGIGDGWIQKKNESKEDSPASGLEAGA